jgi:hypothetical protein
MSDDRYTEWCRDLFARIRPGGLWGIPRTGLVFRKTGPVLLWVGNVPPDIRLHLTPIDEAREAEFKDQVDYFGAAGVHVQRAHVLRDFADMDAAMALYRLNPDSIETIERPS